MFKFSNTTPISHTNSQTLKISTGNGKGAINFGNRFFEKIKDVRRCPFVTLSPKDKYDNDIFIFGNKRNENMKENLNNAYQYITSHSQKKSHNTHSTAPVTASSIREKHNNDNFTSDINIENPQISSNSSPIKSTDLKLKLYSHWNSEGIPYLTFDFNNNSNKYSSNNLPPKTTISSFIKSPKQHFNHKNNIVEEMRSGIQAPKPEMVKNNANE